MAGVEHKAALSRPLETVVDIGANRGQFSLAARAISGAKVVSFEPLPDVAVIFPKILASLWLKRWPVGKPVLISNKVQIWKGIEADGAGLVADDTLEGTVDLLRQWLNMSDEVFGEMKRRASQCFENRFQVRGAAERLQEILGESK